MGKPPHERRTSLRIAPAKDAPVRVDLNGEDFLDIFYATDISTGGLGLRVPHDFNGCKIDLPVDCLVTLPPPVSRSFRAQGRIIHISGHRFGIAFRDLHPDSEQLAKRYIGYRLKQLSWLAWLAHSLGLVSLSARFL